MRTVISVLGAFTIAFTAVSTLNAEPQERSAATNRKDDFMATGRKTIPKRCFRLADQRGWGYQSHHLNRIRAARALYRTGQC